MAPKVTERVPSPVGSEAKPRSLNESPVDNLGFPKTSEVEFRGFLRGLEVPEPAGETRWILRSKRRMRCKYGREESFLVVP